MAQRGRKPEFTDEERSIFYASFATTGNLTQAAEMTSLRIGKQVSKQAAWKWLAERDKNMPEPMYEHALQEARNLGRRYENLRLATIARLEELVPESTHIGHLSVMLASVTNTLDRISALEERLAQRGAAPEGGKADVKEVAAELAAALREAQRRERVVDVEVEEAVPLGLRS